MDGNFRAERSLPQEQEQRERFRTEFQEQVLNVADGAELIAEFEGRHQDAKVMRKLYDRLQKIFVLPVKSIEISRRKVTKEHGLKHPEHEHPGTYLKIECDVSASLQQSAEQLFIHMNIWGGYGIEQSSLHHHQGDFQQSEKLKKMSEKVVDEPVQVSVAVHQTSGGTEQHVVNFKFQLNKNKSVVIGSAMLGAAEDPDYSLSSPISIRAYHGSKIDPGDPQYETVSMHQTNYQASDKGIREAQRMGVELTPRI